jgi:hypothetical protein
MAYDEQLADRVRAQLAIRAGLTERKMFGGIAFMVGDHMACGVIGDELIVRVPREDYDRALAEEHTRQFDFTGRPMRGFVCVTPAGIADDDDLSGWVDAGADHAASLPPK